VGETSQAPHKAFLRRRLVMWGLLALGFVLSFGGYVMDREGNVVLVIPLWVSALGLFTVFGALYLWILNWTPVKH
jgi:hypothetical protein